jgi:hypothetical protein
MSPGQKLSTASRVEVKVSVRLCDDARVTRALSGYKTDVQQSKSTETF